MLKVAAVLIAVCFGAGIAASGLILSLGASTTAMAGPTP